MSKNFKQFSKAIWEKYEVVEEENKPTNPELWARAKSMAKKKFDVYPSAYANGWASKWYKSKGGGWKSVSEAVEPEKKDEYDGEVDMAKNQLKRIISHAQHFHDMLTDKDQNLPEWVQSKVTKAEDYISSAHDYMMGEMQEATYTAFHIKHGKKTVQADSTYGAAKAAASHWNTGKKGTQGINVHLHTDKPQAYTEETMDEDYKQGQSAFKAGKKYSDNPHPKGSDAHLQWSKGHNTARANKLSEGVAGAVAGGALGAMTGGPVGAIAGGYLGHKVQQAANKKKKNEEVDLEEANFQITYKNPQFSKPQTHTIKAKNADHAQTKFLSYGNPYKVHSVKKVNEDTVTYTHKDTGAKMKSKFITDVAAKNFATQLRSQQHKNIEHHKEDVEKLHEVSPNTKIQNILKKIQDRKNIKPVSDKAYADHVKKSVAARDEYVKKEREAGRTPLYKLSTEDSNIPTLMKKPVEEGYYKSQQIDKMEDERLAKQKKSSSGFKPLNPELLKKAREWDKKHPLPKVRNVTPKGYGPNESVKINTIKEIHRNAKKKVKEKPETFEQNQKLLQMFKLMVINY